MADPENVSVTSNLLCLIVTQCIVKGVRIAVFNINREASLFIFELIIY